jgi:RNA polymerase sigma factor (sigma-70 family)
MAKGVRGAGMRNVRTLYESGTTGNLSDRQLLEQVRDSGGQAGQPALTALVQRHGPMVLRVCRSILRDEHAVEDSFQASFLVLVRRAHSLWVRDSIGPWLYQVAYRVACSARSAAARRRRFEISLGAPADAATPDRERSDLGAIVHEEIARLPERYRAPILLCCLDGLTHQQAASRLGWPLGTVESRLARGRRRLRAGLIRRGVAPAAGLVGAALSAGRAYATVTAELEMATVRAAMRLAAGETATTGVAAASVVALSEGVVRTMSIHTLKLVAATFLAIAALAMGACGWAQQAFRVGAPPARDDDEPALAPLAVSPPRDSAGLLQPDKSDTPTVVKFGDGEPDGKMSLGGSGEMIKFEIPEGQSKLAGLKIHGSRYGQAQPPRESFLIYFLSLDQKRILHTEMALYSVFKRGASEWVELEFDPPVARLPKTFWVVLDFRATQTKGVYVSFDTSTRGQFSRVGLPGIASSEVNFGGDWMIQAKFIK